MGKMETNTINIFGEKFKELRKQAGFTQRNCLGIPWRTVQEWEYGNNIPAIWVQNLVIEKLQRIIQKKD